MSENGCEWDSNSCPHQPKTVTLGLLIESCSSPFIA